MIRILIERESNGNIRSFSVKGHANFADHGQDIVCAGVSAVTVGTVNAAEAVVGVVLNSKMKNGFVQASVPAGIDGSKPEQLQLLLESMLVMLRSIEQSYGDFITIREV